MKDKNGNELQVNDFMLDTTDELCGIVAMKDGKLILSQGQDAYGRDKFDLLEEVVKVGYIKYFKLNKDHVGRTRRAWF